MSVTMEVNRLRRLDASRDDVERGLNGLTDTWSVSVIGLLWLILSRIRRIAASMICTKLPRPNLCSTLFPHGGANDLRVLNELPLVSWLA